MKKVLKITLIMVLVLSMVLVITGCGKKEEENKPEAVANSVNTNENTEPVSKSKTYNTFSKMKNDYVISLEGKEDMGEGEENVVMTMAVKGSNIALDMKSDSQHAAVVYKDNTTYIISHNEKMYMKQEGKDEESFEEMSLFKEDELEEMKDKDFTTGKETIEGTEYEYEEYNEDGVTRYYFSGNELRYMKNINNGEEQLLKINNISSQVDDSLFEIPSDYQSIEL